MDEIKTFENLKEEIIDTGFCIHCGNCVVACPYNLLYFDRDYNVLRKLDTSYLDKSYFSTVSDACRNCNICYSICPQTAILSLDVLEETVFNKKSESLYGNVIEAYVARTLYYDISEGAQSGGVITAILWYLLENRLVDVAIVVSSIENNKLLPHPIIAKTFHNLISAQTNKYSLVPIILKLEEAIADGYKKIALVAPPCQVKALRYLQAVKDERLKTLADSIFLIIGTFCLGTFPMSFLRNNFLKLVDIDINEIDKMRLSEEGLEIYSLNRLISKIPTFKIISNFHAACKTCPDFTGILSDISVGEVGSPKGWSTVLIRSQRGQDVFKGAMKQGLLEAYEIDKSSILGIENISKEKVRRGFISEFGKISSGLRSIEEEKPIMAIFVVFNTGETIYSRVFVKSLIDSLSRGKSDLFTGALTAISTVLKETIKSKKYLEKIDFGDIKILISFRKDFYVAIITEYDSVRLRERLERFAEAFEERFSDKILSFDSVIEHYYDADKLLESIFGLKLEKTNYY